jgi:GTP-binding protein Era
MSDPAPTPTTGPETRCGFIAVIGAPNAGKSTLVNALVGAKVSIVSRKVQTTRMPVRGIATAGTSQLVFIDTPGIFEDVERILGKIASLKTPPVLVLNKVDRVKKERLLDLAGSLNARAAFAATFMISALNGDGVADLKAHLAKSAPPGPWHYPEDEISDAPLRVMAAEITREKIYDRLHDELPYEATVETTSWLEQPKSVRIEQTIYVERDGQKAIVLGAGGRTIKQISMESRQELSAILGRPVHLFLFVKVRSGWADDPERYRDMGLAFPKD